MQLYCFPVFIQWNSHSHFISNSAPTTQYSREANVKITFFSLKRISTKAVHNSGEILRENIHCSLREVSVILVFFKSFFHFFRTSKISVEWMQEGIAIFIVSLFLKWRGGTTKRHASSSFLLLAALAISHLIDQPIDYLLTEETLGNWNTRESPPLCNFTFNSELVPV